MLGLMTAALIAVGASDPYFNLTQAEHALYKLCSDVIEDGKITNKELTELQGAIDSFNAKAPLNYQATLVIRLDETLQADRKTVFFRFGNPTEQELWGIQREGKSVPF